jgi:type II secretory pathway component GspD/PulD (secretin)
MTHVQTELVRVRAGWMRTAAIVVVAALIAGCAAGRAHRRAESASRAGDWDTAVEQYRRAVQADPERTEYKIALERAMITASIQHMDEARIAEARGQLEDALREYRRASEYDPPNRQVAAKVLEIERRMRDEAEAQRPSNLRTLREQARQQGPAPLFNLNTIVPEIRFVNAQLREILGSIGQATGINVTYDSTFNERTYTVAMEGVTLQEALNQILTANQLFYKVVNQRTILVSPDVPAKRNQYEELVIKTYYISNGDPADIVGTLNAVTRVGGQQLAPLMAANKSNNTITVRATEAMIPILDRLVEAADKPHAEIVIDVQILEVNRTRAKQFGIDLGQYTINGVFSPESDPRGTGDTAGTTLAPRPFNVNTVSRGISTADFYLAVPAALVRFLETDTETKLVAKPQLRGSEGALLKLNLGDEIPIPTTTFAPIAQGGAAVNPLVSFTYKPVGVNVEVTPRVSFDGDIRLELLVESSTLGPGISIAGQELPSFGTRKVTTTSRLREGESTLLAGLLRQDQRTQLKGFPWLLRLPLIKQLFSSNDSTVQQSDLVMLLTPRIVRTHELTAQDLAAVYIGTQTNPGFGGPPPLIAPQGGDAPPDPAAPPAVPGQAAPAQAVPGQAPPGQVAPGQVAPGQAPPGAQAAPPAAPAPTANVTSPSSSGQVVLSLPSTDFRVGGGPYTVPISVTNAGQLSSVTLTLTFNAAAVRVRTIQEGSFMRAGGGPATFTQGVDAASGRADIAIVRTGDVTGVAGTGMLAALLFDAIGPGPAGFSLTGTASGPAGAQVNLQFAPVPAVTVR